MDPAKVISVSSVKKMPQETDPRYLIGSDQDMGMVGEKAVMEDLDTEAVGVLLEERFVVVVIFGGVKERVVIYTSVKIGRASCRERVYVLV